MCEFLPALTPSQKSWSSTHRWLSRYSITSTSCRVIDSASKICRNVIFIDVGDCKLVSYIKILISCKFYSYISMIQMYILELILLFFLHKWILLYMYIPFCWACWAVFQPTRIPPSSGFLQSPQQCCHQKVD